MRGAARVGCPAALCLGDLRAGRRGDAGRQPGRDGAERRAGAGSRGARRRYRGGGQGQQTLMLGGAPSRIAIGDPEVADVKVLPASGKRAASVLVYGKKAGTTSCRYGAAPMPRRRSGTCVRPGPGRAGRARREWRGQRGHGRRQGGVVRACRVAAEPSGFRVGGGLGRGRREERGGPVHRRAGRRGPGRGQGGRGAAFRDEAGGHQLRRPQRSLGRHQLDHARWLHRAAGLQQVRAAGLGILAVL